MQLRPYQQEAKEALYQWMAENDGSPLVVIDTGGGKSLVLASIIEDALSYGPDERIIVLTATKELVQQDFEETINLIPNCPAGIYCSGLRARDLHSQVIFASIASVKDKAFKLQRCTLIIVDEAQNISTKGDSMYRKFIRDMRIINGDGLRVVGLTATEFRLDSGLLYTGKDALFDGVAYKTDMLELVRDGYLAPLVSKATITKLDTTGVRTQGGEFVQSDLAKAVDIQEITRAAVTEAAQFGADRKGWLFFGVSVEHCGHIVDELRRIGVTAEAITDKTPNGERDKIIADYKQRKIRALVSVGVLTVGFNARHVDMIAMLRPTKSAGLFKQIAGRGTRLSPETGKENCLLLDFAGNIARFGPVDQIKGRDKSRGEGGGDAVMKTCPQCEEKIHASIRTCPFCAYEFPPPPPKIEHTSSALPVMSNETIDPEWVEVQGVSYAKHEKPGRPPSLRVMYRCGLKQHSEWVSLELMGFPRQKAANWWLKRAGPGKVPATVDEALARVDELNVPVRIQVKPVGKYVEITNYEFPRALPFQQRNQGAAA